MTEHKIGNTLFVIVTEHSGNATESLEKKFKKLIVQAAEREAKSYQSVHRSPSKNA